LGTITNIDTWDQTFADIIRINYITLRTLLTFFRRQVKLRCVIRASRASPVIGVVDGFTFGAFGAYFFDNIIQGFDFGTFLTPVVEKHGRSQRTSLAHVGLCVKESGGCWACCAGKNRHVVKRLLLGTLFAQFQA
jgi:hypothetical protein